MHVGVQSVGLLMNVFKIWISSLLEMNEVAYECGQWRRKSIYIRI